MNTITTKAKDLRRGDIMAGAFDGYVVRVVRRQSHTIYITIRNLNRHGYTKSAVLMVPAIQSVEIVNTYGKEIAS
jgi:hypothetical protein